MNKAFTLVELLVVISIVALLSALTFANYRVGQGRYELSRSANRLTQAIRQVEEMAMSVKEVTGPTGEKVIPQGGYGIYLKLQPQEILLFADCNDNQRFTDGLVCGSSSLKFSEKIEEIKLESNVQIQNLFPTSPLHITFKPPDPSVFISGGDIAFITLSLKSDPSKTKTIKINKTGLINIE